MTALDTLIPDPGLVEISRVDLAAPPEQVWRRVRHGPLPQGAVTKALFALRTLFEGHDDRHGAPATLALDDLRSSAEQPGFQVLVDEPMAEVAVGAIGKVWRLRIPFVHAATAPEFLTFSAAGYVKVAWAIRVSPLVAGGTHLELEVRVAATDPAAWRKFRRYFLIVGPNSRLIRRSLLRALATELGRPAPGDRRALAGDDRLPDAAAQMTHRIDIAATPAEIWPWLAQMGCWRAGFYSIDVLDNGGVPSAREIHPDLQQLSVGDVIPASRRGSGGFEVLHVEPPAVMVLGGLFDRTDGRQLAFQAPRPERFWHVTWAFVLERLDRRSTRLTVRVRGAFSPGERRRAWWMRFAHPIMQAAQLRHLAERAEGRTPRDGRQDVVAGAPGAARLAAGLLTRWLRRRGRRGGLDARSGARAEARQPPR